MHKSKSFLLTTRRHKFVALNDRTTIFKNFLFLEWHLVNNVCVRNISAYSKWVRDVGLCIHTLYDILMIDTAPRDAYRLHNTYHSLVRHETIGQVAHAA